MTYCQVALPLNAAQLKIQRHEIYETLKFGKGWLGSMRLFLLCLTAADLSGLSLLLDQVDEHNHLVSAIEVDLQRATDGHPAQDDLKDLQTAIQTFSRTKGKIMRALAQQNHQTAENTGIVEPMSCELKESGSVYSWLIEKSSYLGMQAQASMHLSM